MFDTTHEVKALSIVMRDPMSWQYFGINDVTLIVEPYAFMMVSGATGPTGERCLVAHGAGLAMEPCLSAIAAGDGREIFRFNGEDQLVNAETSKCMTLLNADTSMGGKLALETCTTATEANDGRSSWGLTTAGQLKLATIGNYCLDVSATHPAVRACANDDVGGGDRFALVAVPEFDASASASSKSTAALLKASAGRQSSLLSQLQEATALLQSCTLAADWTSNSSYVSEPASLLSVEGKKAKASGGVADAAMQAIAQIYEAEDMDIQGVKQLIVDTAMAVKRVHEKHVH